MTKDVGNNITYSAEQIKQLTKGTKIGNFKSNNDL
jgi:hypothetical protein